MEIYVPWWAFAMWSLFVWFMGWATGRALGENTAMKQMTGLAALTRPQGMPGMMPGGMPNATVQR